MNYVEVGTLQEIAVLSDPNDIAPRVFIMTLEQFAEWRPSLLKMFPGITLPIVSHGELDA